MKKLLPVIIAVIIVGPSAFYGGMKYAQSKASLGNRAFGQFQNLSPEDRAQRMQQFQQNGGDMNNMMRRRGDGQGMNFISGEILNKDDKSITIKLPDGGSKIVFFSSSTNIGKSAQGTTEDLAIGENVMANGSANSDGSMTAQTIQIRPKPQNTPAPQPNN